MKEGQGGVTLTELCIVVAGMFLLAMIAMPRWADLTIKAREGATKGKLGAMKTALKVYYVDHEGDFPADLDALVPRYIGEVPKAHPAPHHPASKAVRVGATLPEAVDDSGGWSYINGPGDSLQGTILVNCTHDGSKGEPWAAVPSASPDSSLVASSDLSPAAPSVSSLVTTSGPSPAAPSDSPAARPAGDAKPAICVATQGEKRPVWGLRRVVVWVRYLKRPARRWWTYARVKVRGTSTVKRRTVKQVKARRTAKVRRYKSVVRRVSSVRTRVRRTVKRIRTIKRRAVKWVRTVKRRIVKQRTVKRRTVKRVKARQAVKVRRVARSEPAVWGLKPVVRWVKYRMGATEEGRPPTASEGRAGLPGPDQPQPVSL